MIERDYFTTEMFRTEANINRRLSLREIQDVLNFIHTYAWRLSLSLRMVRDTAVERVMSPDNWDTKLIAGLLPEAQLKIPLPPAPEMFGRNVREGLPSKATGYERRQAKRMQRAQAAPTPPDDPDPDDDPPPPPSGHDAPTPPDEPTTPDLPPNPDPPEPERGTAQDFRRLLNYGWTTADIAKKYGRSEAEIEPMIEPSDEPPRIYKTIDQAITEIYTNGKARTCANVAAVLGRWPIRSWDEDTRVRVAEDLWHATDPALWQDGVRVSVIEAYIHHRPAIYGGPLILLFADQSDALQFDAHGDLQMVSWTEIETMMAPYIEEQRKQYEQRQRQDEGNTIARSKLPPKRKLKAMHERIDRLLELNPVTISEKGQQAIAYIRAMTTDDPDFGECVTFSDYLQHVFKKLPTDDPPDEPVAP